MISGLRGALFLAAWALAPAVPAAAQAPGEAVRPAIPSLKAGQSIWFETPQLVKASTVGTPIKVVVAIRQQQALVYQGNRLLGVTTVSTGAPGYETPLGEFTILEKKVFHRSNLYSNAPMPHMQRLTWGGVALHAGQLPGYPASHGCIRLPRDFARQLYDLTAMGGTVMVVDDVADAPLYLPPEPMLMADTGSLNTSATSYTAPLLAADMRDLGGAAYDVLTMGGDPPPAGQRRSR
ncbi:MAG: L,D-transpeptidase family protein [Sphingomonas sp.]|uniref:L,D-transpeptidase family protein n=1 Tax=Sphingomonas sp. TaxID=28214 RepID=UPI0022754670|nr:L,D-transpeptidase family protein [Sphingomonas sp.]MCX8474556.1 L,D-transpeptidase family protein [Sphingomonas sp.]